MANPAYYFDGLARLLRTRWYDPQVLAEEIFLLLANGVRGPNLGPITIDLNDGSPPRTIRADNLRDPSGAFRLPDLEFPELNLANYGLPDRDNLGHLLNPMELNFIENIFVSDTSPDGTNQPRETTRQRTEVIRHRTVVPGKIVSGSGRTYTMTLYPNGEDADGFNVAGVTHMDVDPAEVFPVGMWFLVWRYLETKVTTTSVFATIPGTQYEVEVAKRVDIQFTQKKHRILGEIWP